MSTKTLALLFIGILLFAAVATTLALTFTGIMLLPSLTIPKSVKEAKEAVLKLGRPELTVEIVDVHGSSQPWKPKTNERTIVLAEIRNLWLGKAKNVAVKLLVDGKPVNETKIRELNPLETKRVELSWTPETYGNKTIQVVVDPENRIKELSEENNRRVGIVKVEPPELTVEALPSDGLKVDEEAAITIHVKNIGLGVAKNFTVKLLIDGKTVGEEKIGKLSSLEEKTVKFTWKPEKYGNRTVTVLVDPENRVEEPNEENNRWTGTVKVEPLCVYGKSLEPYVKYNVTVTAKLRCVKERIGFVDNATGQVKWDLPPGYEAALPIKVWGIKIVVPEELDYIKVSDLKITPKPLAVREVEHGTIGGNWYEERWNKTYRLLTSKEVRGTFTLSMLKAKEYTWVWEGEYYPGDESPQVTVSYVLTVKLPDIIADPNKVALADHLKGHVKIIPPEAIGNAEDVPKKLKKYTEHLVYGEFFYRAKDPEIASLAKKLTKGKPNAYYKVKAIVEWIRENIEYEADVSHDPIDILRSGKADCDGYANLLASLCRAIGIPALTVSGYLYAGDGIYCWSNYTYYEGANGYVEEMWDRNPHAWALLYLPNYGWIPVDIAARYHAPFIPEESSGCVLNDVVALGNVVTLARGEARFEGEIIKVPFSYLIIKKIEIKKLE